MNEMTSLNNVGKICYYRPFLICYGSIDAITMAMSAGEPNDVQTGRTDCQNCPKTHS